MLDIKTTIERSRALCAEADRVIAETVELRTKVQIERLQRGLSSNRDPLKARLLTYAAREQLKQMWMHHAKREHGRWKAMGIYERRDLDRAAEAADAASRARAAAL